MNAHPTVITMYHYIVWYLLLSAGIEAMSGCGSWVKSPKGGSTTPTSSQTTSPRQLAIAGRLSLGTGGTASGTVTATVMTKSNDGKLTGDAVASVALDPTSKTFRLSVPAGQALMLTWADDKGSRTMRQVLPALQLDLLALQGTQRLIKVADLSRATTSSAQLFQALVEAQGFEPQSARIDFLTVAKLGNGSGELDAAVAAKMAAGIAKNIRALEQSLGHDIDFGFANRGLVTTVTSDEAAAAPLAIATQIISAEQGAAANLPQGLTKSDLTQSDEQSIKAVDDEAARAEATQGAAYNVALSTLMDVVTSSGHRRLDDVTLAWSDAILQQLLNEESDQDLLQAAISASFKAGDDPVSRFLQDLQARLSGSGSDDGAAQVLEDVLAQRYKGLSTNEQAGVLGDILGWDDWSDAERDAARGDVLSCLNQHNVATATDRKAICQATNFVSGSP